MTRASLQSLVRSLPSLPAFASCALIVLAGCGGGAPTGGGNPASADNNVLIDPASCGTVVPKDFDRSCKVDSDCVPVVIGGDTCDPCAEPELFICPSGVVNKSAAPAYKAAIRNGLGAASGSSFSCGQIVSCPEVHPVCSHGECRTEFGCDATGKFCGAP